VVSGYTDTTDWRSFKWGMQQMAEYWLHLGWTRSNADLYKLWFNRKAYVLK